MFAGKISFLLPLRHTKVSNSSSGKMPLGVREALVDIFRKEGNMTHTEDQARLQQMEKNDRYQQETW